MPTRREVEVARRPRVRPPDHATAGSPVRRNGWWSRDIARSANGCTDRGRRASARLLRQAIPERHPRVRRSRPTRPACFGTRGSGGDEPAESKDRQADPEEVAQRSGAAPPPRKAASLPAEALTMTWPVQGLRLLGGPGRRQRGAQPGGWTADRPAARFGATRGGERFRRRLEVRRSRPARPPASAGKATAETDGRGHQGRRAPPEDGPEVLRHGWLVGRSGCVVRGNGGRNQSPRRASAPRRGCAGPPGPRDRRSRAAFRTGFGPAGRSPRTGASRGWRTGSQPPRDRASARWSEGWRKASRPRMR